MGADHDDRPGDDQTSAFLQTVSHDLRNPLIVIEGFASLLATQPDQLTEDERRDYARRIHDAARRMRRQLNDLLDVDRLGRGVVEPNRRPTDVCALAAEAVVSLDLTERVALDSADPPLVVDVDPGQVERILENLLSNAARHTTAATRIWVQVGPADDGILLRVDDDGPGVPVDVRDRIWDAFETGPGESGGTGVGLALVRRFAELHGGRAWVEDRPGGGASFRVHLPTG